MKLIETGFLPRTAASCHASTILPLSGGGLLCAWFAGDYEGADNVKIYLSRRGGGPWSRPEAVSQTEGPNWNPVLFENGAGEILLYYKTGRPIARWRTMLRVSQDGGATFSPVRELVPGDAGGRGPVRNHPIALKNGLILAPASLEEGTWRAFCDVSRDGGHTFAPSNSIAIPGVSGEHRGVIQPALWQDGSGVHMLLRSTEGQICRSDSPDGLAWPQARPTGLVNNNSGIDLCRLSDGRLVLAHNPVSQGRTPLILSVSSDDGHTFAPALTLASEPGEYSYPSVFFDGRFLHVTHTWKREDIRYARIEV